jgi:hypothetical protein
VLCSLKTQTHRLNSGNKINQSLVHVTAGPAFAVKILRGNSDQSKSQQPLFLSLSLSAPLFLFSKSDQSKSTQLHRWRRTALSCASACDTAPLLHWVRHRSWRRTRHPGLSSPRRSRPALGDSGSSGAPSTPRAPPPAPCARARRS